MACIHFRSTCARQVPFWAALPGGGVKVEVGQVAVLFSNDKGKR